jgi:hypothetical protein
VIVAVFPRSKDKPRHLIPERWRRVTVRLDSYNFARIERLVIRTGPRSARQSRATILRQCIVYGLHRIETIRRAEGNLPPFVWPELDAMLAAEAAEDAARKVGAI